MFLVKYIIVVLAVGMLASTVIADEYIEPEDIYWLPQAAKERLKREECRIQRSLSGINVSPVVVGQFAVPGQFDLAVICGGRKESYIYVFWGGDATCPSRFSSFGESLSVVDEYYIYEHYHAYGGNKPPKIEHEGINDIILEKASVVRYCHDGNWIELTGAD